MGGRSSRARGNSTQQTDVSLSTTVEETDLNEREQERQRETEELEKQAASQMQTWEREVSNRSKREKLRFYRVQLESLPQISGNGLDQRLNAKINELCQQIEESNRILKAAMKKGKVEVKNTNVLILGMAGTGKTCTKSLIFSMPPPEVRNSTPLANEPVRAITCHTRDVTGTRIQAGNSDNTNREWTKIEKGNLIEQIAAETMNFSKSDRSRTDITSIDQRPTGSHPKNEPKPQQRFRSKSAANMLDRPVQKTKTNNTPTPTLSEVTVQHSQLEHTLSAEVKQVIDQVYTRFEGHIDETENQNLSVSLGNNWIYFIDSGGQPHFYNLLPLFIKGISITLFTHRLHDNLSDYYEVEYFEDGQCIGKFSSTQTVRDTLQCLAASMQSTVCANDQKPQLLFIATFRDKVSGDQLNKTVTEKNRDLLACFPSEFREQLIFNGEDMTQIIFPLNAKNPDDQDREVVKEIREAIENAPAENIEVPFWWFTLDILLSDLSEKLERKVISKHECKLLASKLKVNEQELDHALQYLHDKHLLHYYHDILSSVVFTSPQVLLDKLTELVQKAYQLREKRKSAKHSTAAASGLWRSFRDEGIISLQLLHKFPRHYIKDIFEASDLLKIFTSHLITAPISDQTSTNHDFKSCRAEKYFMPAVLNSLCQDKLEKYRNFSQVEPLIFCLKSGPSRMGIFCCLQVYLLGKGWTRVMNDNKPKLTMQNCVILSHSKLPCTITLMDSFSYIEVYVSTTLSDYHIDQWVCTRIREDISHGLTTAMKTLCYSSESNSAIETAFFCPCNQQKTLSSTESEVGSSRHIAKVRANSLHCQDKQEEFIRLSDKHKVWQAAANPSTLHSATSIVLTVDSHLTPVRGAIFSARNKWRDIGRGLNVSDDILESIERSHCNLGEDSSAECLYRMLKKWIESGHANIHELLYVLEGEVVGQKELVHKIRAFEGYDREKIGLD